MQKSLIHHPLFHTSVFRIIPRQVKINFVKG
jgi:hypothetical protein